MAVAESSTFLVDRVLMQAILWSLHPGRGFRPNDRSAPIADKMVLGDLQDLTTLGKRFLWCGTTLYRDGPFPGWKQFTIPLWRK